MELDDRQFISLCKEDRERAFHLLVNAYSSRIYNACLNMIRNKEDAEDLTQEVFTAVYLSIEKFEGSSKLSTWIYSIALNKSKEFLRNKTRKKRFGIFTVIERDDSHFMPSAVVDFDHPGVLLENKDRSRILFEALDQLASNQRDAYTLHKIEGLSYDEIATILSVSKSSVESLMFRAKQNLQKILKDYYEKNER